MNTILNKLNPILYKSVEFSTRVGTIVDRKKALNKLE